MKRFILKPGKHQFAPGEAAMHDNDNLTDADAEWYMERYPHIKSLFAPWPPEGAGITPQEKPMKVRTKRKRVGKPAPPLGGEGGI